MISVLEPQTQIPAVRVPLRVIVSHPARQANIYYRPRAAEQMGAEVVFLTGLYYRPHRFPYSAIQYVPAARRDLSIVLLDKRWGYDLNPNMVIRLLYPITKVTLRPIRSII